jgi:hypothetical protein
VFGAGGAKFGCNQYSHTYEPATLASVVTTPNQIMESHVTLTRVPLNWTSKGITRET